MRWPEGLRISPLEPGDFAGADALLMTAFQHSGGYNSELSRFHALQPDGLLLATLDGRAAGTVSAIEYGACAWIGLLAVAPNLQGRGIGTLLMATLLDWLDGRACPLSLLDATAAGAPLYTRLGFEDHDQTVRYVKAGDAPARGERAATIQSLALRDVDHVMSFDRTIFGADRGAALGSLVETYRGRTLVSRDAQGHLDGYVLATERRIGPWLAADEQVAATLLSAALDLPFVEQPHVIGPAANPALTSLVARHGFTEQGRLRHMRRGSGPYPCRRASIYGQASYALG